MSDFPPGAVHIQFAKFCDPSMQDRSAHVLSIETGACVRCGWSNKPPLAKRIDRLEQFALIIGRLLLAHFGLTAQGLDREEQENMLARIMNELRGEQ